MYISSERLASRGQTSAPAQPPLLDNPFAPELFVTGCAGFANLGGIIRVTLENLQCDHSRREPAMERVVVGRLTLPVGAAQMLVCALNAFLEEQKLSPSKAMMSGAQVQ